MNDEAWDVKIRPAPNGKVYAGWQGRVICEAGGGLRYFDSEDDARDFLERCDLADLLGASAP
jgi:hypothetical protein